MRSTLSLLIIWQFGFSIYAQTPSVNLTLEEAEKIFLEKNLLLLAKQFNIKAADALVIQAKSYPNPLFTAYINVYDPQHEKYFHIDSSGQKSFQIQQLILMGGKRRNEIEIARQNKSLAE